MINYRLLGQFRSIKSIKSIKEYPLTSRPLSTRNCAVSHVFVYEIGFFPVTDAQNQGFRDKYAIQTCVAAAGREQDGERDGNTIIEEEAT